MFTSLENQIPSTLSIAILVYVQESRAFPLLKLIFKKTHFTRGTLDFASQKLRLRLIKLMEFNFRKTLTYLHEICQLFMIHIQFASAILQGQRDFKDKNC
jgi:hypothetical protein